MWRFFGRVGAILVGVLCVNGAIADDFADCMECAVAQEDGPHWLLSVTFEDPDTRFGVAVGDAEIATPLERTLTDAGIRIDSSWTIALRLEISL